MKKAKLLSLVLAIAMLVCIVPTSVLAVIPDIDRIASDGPITFLPLEVGKTYEGEIQGDEPFITVPFSSENVWQGIAKGFTVTLDGYTEYTINVHVEGDDAAYVDRAIAVYYEGELGPYVTDEVNGSSIDLSLSFESYLAGEYQIIVWGYCDDADGNALFDYTTVEVTIDKALNMLDYSTVIDPGDNKEITLKGTEPYFESRGYYGYGYAFSTNLIQGKHYLINVEATRSEDIATHDLSNSLGFAEHKDGELQNALGVYDYEFSYVVTADRTGKFEFLFLGETYDGTLSQRIFGDLVFYNISVTEMNTFYFDIDCEDDYIDFIDELNALTYAGSTVVATIYGNLDFTGNDLCYGINTDASLLIIEGVGNTTIEGITEPLVAYANNVRIDYITAKGNLYYTESQTNIGLLVGLAYNATINNCSAIGFIDFNGALSAEDIGGLAGDVEALTVSNTDVMVDITAENADYFSYVGGICGYNGTIDAQNVSYNGDITAKSVAEFDTIGGFVGETYSNGVFENCTVNGNIESNAELTTETTNEYNIGGFAGYIEDYSVFNNCNVNADIYNINCEYVGGFAGFIDEANEFYNCYAAGSVTGSVRVGGFIGASDCCGLNKFVNCYTDSTIIAKDRIGGFIGETYYDDSFENCYAYSDIVCINTETAETYIGTFIGYAPHVNYFTSVYAHTSSKYDVIGSGYSEEIDPSDINVVSFKVDEDVATVVDEFNALVKEANKEKVYDYKLMYWSSDNEAGIPMLVEAPEYVIGDADLNGVVNSTDYLLVKRHCFNTYTLEGDAYLAANVNPDETINSTDYLLIKRICFGTYVAE